MTELKLYFAIPNDSYSQGIENFNIFIQEAVVPFFSSFTLQDATGYWNGKPEKTIIMTICTIEGIDRIVIKEICKKYCILQSQECVMVTYLTNMAGPEMYMYGKD